MKWKCNLMSGYGVESARLVAQTHTLLAEFN
jgi:hypothetical protein